MSGDPGQLVIGTAQLSGSYGIANRHGMPSAAELSAILSFAQSAGITMIDTAAAYGDAEVALGAAGVGAFDVISKLPPDVAPGSVSRAVERSLERLCLDSLSGLLLHRAAPGQRTIELLHETQEDARVTRAGVSVYEPADLEWLLDHDAPLDIVQAPFSVFDQRFRPIGEELRRRRAEFHARSVFLQGLYFLEEHELKGTLAPAREPLGALRRVVRAAGVPTHALLLCYAAAQAFISRIVIGVERVSQLEANVAAIQADPKLAALLPELDSMALADEDVLLPSRWYAARP